MVNMAKIDTIELAQETGLSTEDVKKVVKQIIDDKDNHKREPKPQPPEGGISLRAAERKYGIPNRTISRWAARGLIPILLRTKNELYVDEIVLKKLIEKYKQAPGRGKRTIKAGS
jgi:hypothetical protein